MNAEQTQKAERKRVKIKEYSYIEENLLYTRVFLFLLRWRRELPVSTRERECLNHRVRTTNLVDLRIGHRAGMKLLTLYEAGWDY